MFEFLPWWMYIIDIVVIVLAAIMWGDPFSRVRNSIWHASTVVLLIAAIATLFLSSVSPFDWISHNPSLFIGGLAAYALVGIIWAIVYWWGFFLKSDYVESLIRTSYSRYKLLTSDKEVSIPFEKSEQYPFTFAKNSGEIISWATFWPIHIIWAFFSEFLINIFNWFGRLFSSFFAKLASKRVSEVIQKTEE